MKQKNRKQVRFRSRTWPRPPSFLHSVASFAPVLLRLVLLTGRLKQATRPESRLASKRVDWLSRNKIIVLRKKITWNQTAKVERDWIGKKV